MARAGESLLDFTMMISLSADDGCHAYSGAFGIAN